MNSCANFATNLLLQKVQENSERNVVISPLSLSAVVAMLAAGSSGKTLDDVLKFAETESLEKLKSEFSKSMSIANSCSGGAGPKISFANGAWVDRRFPFKPSYAQCLRETFNTEATTKDFLNHGDEAVRDINSWAEEKTNGLIKGIITKDDISDPSMAVVMANALHFKGLWSEPFKSQLTEDRHFYLANGQGISKVPFMTYFVMARRPLYGSFRGFDVVELPYRNGKHRAQSFSMQIILPHEKDGLQNMIQRFDADPDLLKRPFKLRKTLIDVFWIPKFKFEFDLDKVMFPFAENMMLTEMIQSVYPAELLNIKQKAIIEVDEKGTEAAAVTGLMCYGSRKMPKREKKEFVADHPFMFIIKEDASGLVLFTGALLNPDPTTKDAGKEKKRKRNKEEASYPNHERFRQGKKEKKKQGGS